MTVSPPNVPTISILIPALRPDWLDTAIASALAQTWQDFELLIGDDSSDDRIGSVVRKWDDARIRYVRNPRPRQPGTNRDHLIELACGEYLKFLFDDDLLLPRSIELLLQACRETGAPLAFHARHLIDTKGCVLGSPMLVAAGERVVLEPSAVFERMVSGCVNLIGEPTNILVHRQTLRAIDAPFSLDGHRMRFLTDMALYANFASRSHSLVAVGYLGAGFRQHAAQASVGDAPGRSAGYFEWDLLRRWAVDNGHLDRHAYERDRRTMRAMYRQIMGRYPEVKAFVDLLDSGPDETSRWPALDADFQEALAMAYAQIEIRKLRRAETLAATPATP